MPHHVQRTNTTTTPPRYEWLRAKPTFDPVTEVVSDLRWTWRDPGDPSGWRNGNPPHHFERKKAARWASMIDGAEAVRMGEPDADEFVDLSKDSRAEARRRERKAAEEGDPL